MSPVLRSFKLKISPSTKWTLWTSVGMGTLVKFIIANLVLPKEVSSVGLHLSVTSSAFQRISSRQHRAWFSPRTSAPERPTFWRPWTSTSADRSAWPSFGGSRPSEPPKMSSAPSATTWPRCLCWRPWLTTLWPTFCRRKWPLQPCCWLSGSQEVLPTNFTIHAVKCWKNTP